MRFVQKIFPFIWLLTTALAVVAQEPADESPVVIGPRGGHTAPILWQHYQLPDEKLSVMLPKLPVQSPLGDPLRPDPR